VCLLELNVQLTLVIAHLLPPETEVATHMSLHFSRNEMAVTGDEEFLL
jgi:hypothetical protein